MLKATESNREDSFSGSKVLGENRVCDNRITFFCRTHEYIMGTGVQRKGEVGRKRTPGNGVNSYQGGRTLKKRVGLMAITLNIESRMLFVLGTREGEVRTCRKLGRGLANLQSFWVSGGRVKQLS